ncbi:MAG: class I lanthipeptide [Flammeovirgaceae bacterium]|nr:class I lanthipeptide [Flammeovirgaceae bacterium]
MKKELKNKLELRKETFSILSKSQMNTLRGGETDGAYCTDYPQGCSNFCAPPSHNTLCNCQ